MDRVPINRIPMNRVRRLSGHILATNTVSGNTIYKSDFKVQSEKDMREICCAVMGWDATDAPKLLVKTIEGGITNKLSLCIREDGQKALVRVYGANTDLFIDRNEENRVFAELTRLNFGVKLLGLFGNGRVEEWFDNARTLEPDDLADPVISSMFARRLADLHAQPISGDRSPMLFKKLQEWLSISLDCQFPATEQARKIQAINLGQFEEELNWLEATLKKIPSPVVFAHNDALAGNILMGKKETADGKSETQIEIIDLEYGGFNYRGFDLGNHFCEFSGFDYNKILEKYPNKAEQYAFFHAYLRHARGPTARISDLELDQLYREANKYGLASHLFWGLWAVVQAKYSKIDFDYLEYARQRFSAYFLFKEKFENL